MTETDQLDLFGPAVALGRHILAEEARDKRRRRPKARRAVPEPVESLAELYAPETRRRAIEARDDGMSRAVEHAEATVANWQQIAADFLRSWIAGRTEPFQASEVRIASAGSVPAPPSARSWGNVLRSARVGGLIELDGIEPHLDPRSHRTPANRWRPVKP